MVEDIKKKRQEFQLQAGKQGIEKNSNACCKWLAILLYIIIELNWSGPTH